MEYKYRGRLNNPSFDKLFEAILLLEDKEQCYMFFEDICSVAELKSLAQRLEVAEMLNDNKTYGEIVEASGASTATISRVKRTLYYGADGYTMIWEKSKKKA